ncbi:MAG: SCO family protein [Gammaproteobacteria bacterium]|nr:SCO family protein [Gammaproteobacteria bacterium]
MPTVSSPRARPARRLTGLVAGALVLLVFGCAPEDPWALKDISGLMPRLEFTLTSDAGQTVHGRDYRGKVVLLYFGYTHCPDICPTTMSKLARALDQVEGGTSGTRVLFVSVDPERDSREVLARYVEHFGEQFVGIRGTQRQLKLLTKRYRVTYGYGEPDEDGNYPVSHSSAVFVFDEDGQARLMGRRQDSVGAFAADLRRLLGEG